MNSSPNNIWTSVILHLNSFIQILHIITHLHLINNPMRSN
jgi:hypothetical protein